MNDPQNEYISYVTIIDPRNNNKLEIKIFDDDYKYCANINIQNCDEWRQELFNLLDKYGTFKDLDVITHNLRNGKQSKLIIPNGKSPIYTKYESIKSIINPLKEISQQPHVDINQIQKALLILLRIFDNYIQRGCVNQASFPWMFDQIRYSQQRKNKHDIHTIIDLTT